MLNEETSMPGSLPGPRVHTDIPEGELNEATSVPGSLPGPHITNDILGKEVNEETSVPGPSIPTGTPKEAAFVSEPSIADNYLEQEVEILKGLQNDYVQRQMRVLQAINLQIGHTRTRLIRSEVRLQWWGKEGDQALMPVIQTASHGQRDLRSCQECLQNLKALRVQLRRLRSRLARVEATMGILVPPRELDVDEEKEKDKNQTVLHT
ncbi:uncharacterized protein LOC128324229 isoform X2 [Hemicordylus capensis]|uniref:uncharacterized protein LOC128324229 isoform X2 n=1 Tax=Hemicordylus capensis TaxID=884348 RepID=UPI0023033735|nr:uncharacterized protein LOC128324229 isoform X2 [Hemicordylus capensis]